MKLLKSLAVTGIAFLCSQAVAVDGFQELKFGMTLDEVKKQKNVIGRNIKVSIQVINVVISLFSAKKQNI
ncbi:hypothetical protein P2G70_07385 [Mannheimia haemolytica]|nr:hypothetical protein [Mannheimia haemolytica]